MSPQEIEEWYGEVQRKFDTFVYIKWLCSTLHSEREKGMILVFK